MQTRMKRSGLGWRSRGGSALVAAVTFVAIMSIAGAGLLKVMGSGTNNEILMLDDTRAFHAAESGLWLGIRWLRDQTNYTAFVNAGVDVADLLPNMSVDGIPVTVALTNVGPNIRLSGRAQSSSLLGYSKVVSVDIERKPVGWYTTFIQDLEGSNTDGFIDTEFWGRFHSNSSIFFQQGAGGGIETRFRGPVTIHNQTGTGPAFEFDFLPQVDLSSGDYGGYGTSTVTGNNYDFGVAYKTADNPSYFDAAFESTYEHSQPEVILQWDVGTITQVNLPTTASANTINSPATRPTIEFYVDAGVGRYRYYTAGNPVPAATGVVGSPLIINAQAQHVNVVGQVVGQVSVVTDPGYSIYPVGNLTVTGFNSGDPGNNYGLSGSNTNVVALKSGKDIAFGTQAFNPATLAVTDMETQWVTAQLVALENDGSAVWTEKVAGAPPYAFDINPYDGDYRLRVVGSRTFDSYKWFKDTGADKEPLFYEDRRLANGLMGPGLRGFVEVIPGEPALLDFVFTNWQQQNPTS